MRLSWLYSAHDVDCSCVSPRGAQGEGVHDWKTDRLCKASISISEFGGRKICIFISFCVFLCAIFCNTEPSNNCSGTVLCKTLAYLKIYFGWRRMFPAITLDLSWLKRTNNPSLHHTLVLIECILLRATSCKLCSFIAFNWKLGGFVTMLNVKLDAQC